MEKEIITQSHTIIGVLATSTATVVGWIMRKIFVIDKHYVTKKDMENRDKDLYKHIDAGLKDLRKAIDHNKEYMSTLLIQHLSTTDRRRDD